jgi:hypothetical protein
MGLLILQAPKNEIVNNESLILNEQKAKEQKAKV